MCSLSSDSGDSCQLFGNCWTFLFALKVLFFFMFQASSFKFHNSHLPINWGLCVYKNHLFAYVLSVCSSLFTLFILLLLSQKLGLARKEVNDCAGNCFVVYALKPCWGPNKDVSVNQPKHPELRALRLLTSSSIHSSACLNGGKL